MKLILSADQDKSIEVSAGLVQLKTEDRFKISLKKFSLFFGLAIVSLFIPVLHFFLVPLFLVVSIIFAVKAFSARYRLKIEGPCLCIQCQHPLKTELLLDENMRLKCENCFAHYLVR